ncbi:Polysaccharide pyruvyl transferase family protein WcaK [Loktanella fryxellensis]|uniref:Polysaccharide pyruvyl transferase family protein WcaK n=1 Tax=Loktanella fryxellensis TaxID=245187 RepID=A0A1H8H550_9RHOB|nr:polysaccharide pyruvyl transferase family protein [Loktanella fryxellensis]SEN51482.1 Polysaccharide pyruvyl transferase family protein WcaK [Loktanella fryxellensis]
MSRATARAASQVAAQSFVRHGIWPRLKPILAAVLPDPVARLLHRTRRGMAARRMTRQWDALRLSLDRQPTGVPPRSILIMPGDPQCIAGSVGDEAMIAVVIDRYRATCPDLKVAVLCSKGAPEAVVRARGLRPVILPGGWNFADRMAEILALNDFDALVVVGADVMDGYYSPDYSTQMIIAADLAARSGLQTTVLGFSFNARPTKALAHRLARLHRGVALNVRDQTSLDRIRRFAPVSARLVADSAFLLSPGTIDTATARWIAGERQAGRRVIGVNLHPMLVRGAAPGQLDHLVARMTRAIAAADATTPLSWMLIPHDYRDTTGDGDMLCLTPLMDRLAALPGLRVRLFEGTHPAATLKALAGQMDGIVSGRMHLAIAALGMGVPVLCLTYQDKFEGLFRHFDLPARYLLSPADLADGPLLTDTLCHFLQALPALTARVRHHTPGVMTLALQNFDPAATVAA